MKKIQIKFYILLTVMAVMISSCTDLKIEETDSIFIESSGGEFTGLADVAASLDGLYGSVRGQLEGQENYYALNEVTADEYFVPTRGTDWGDNSIWRSLTQHAWSPTHLFVLRCWNDWNSAVFKANQIIDSRSNANPQQLAEARFIRAYSMWIILDLYGQVPFREVDEGPEINPVVMSRTDALDFVLQDLEAAIAGLTSIAPGAGTNKAGKAAALFLKAKVLLNKHIYTGSGSADSADMTAVINAVDDITAEGYALEAGYFALFTAATDTETIWHTASGVGNRIWNGLHYFQITPDNTGGGWNGFSTLAEFYDTFEGNPNSNYVGDGQEERRGWVPDASNADDTNYGIGYGFLIGQQYDRNGVPYLDRAGAPLVFTKELPGLIGNNESHGIRLLKWHPANGAFAGHLIVFRYADAYLMKAEAMMRSGGDPTAMVNVLRALRDASALGNVSESDMLDERGRELYAEMSRRNDLIRFGQWTRDWEFKDPGAVGNEDLNLYPIPTNALLSNPNLVQNPGY